MVRRGKGFLLGAFLGTVVGGITALLFAPKTGEKMRKDLSRTCDDLCCKTEDFMHSASCQAKDLLEKTKDLASEAKEKAEDLLREIKRN